VLAKANRFTDVLRSTHDSIPQLSNEGLRLSSRLGGAAISGTDVDQLHVQLAACQERREDHMRQRAAAAGLLALEPELNDARAATEQVRERIATSVVLEFQQRWSRCCQELAPLRSESIVLANALHMRVPCEAPYRIVIGAATGQSELRFSQALESAQPPVALSPELGEVVSTLLHLSTAISMIAGIKQSQQLDERSFQLALKRKQPLAIPGTFRVLQGFTCLIDNLVFEPTTLIDAGLIGSGMLARLLRSGRYLRPASLESAVA
jgi:hypothetical protein